MFQRSPARERAANLFRRQDLVKRATPEKPPEKVVARSYEEIRARVLEESRTSDNKGS